LLKQVLTAGRYTFWKGVINYDFIRADISKIEIADNIERACCKTVCWQAMFEATVLKAMKKHCFS
jgi:hypothetical protein